MSMEHTRLMHPWPYDYFLKPNNSRLQQFPRLKHFLTEMRMSCPNDKFLDGPRSSTLKFDAKTQIIEVKNHEVTRLAKEGLEWGMQGTAHGNVQLWAMKQDSKSIAVEIPLWLEENELQEIGLRCEKGGCLSGHIDLLTIEGNKIWIWDFKPKAEKEKYADTQTLVYAFMLSKRTGIPLDNFMCGYFDEKTSYIFKPGEENIEHLVLKEKKPRRKPVRRKAKT